MKDDAPTAYQRGWIEFYKLKFHLTSDVLIPRPETELLVDEVLTFLKKNPESNNILDLGTGAGAIAISVATNNPQVKITATEISEPALKVAQKNAQFHQVEQLIDFKVSDLLKALPADLNPNIIVTNLPYIPHDRIAYLDSSVKDYEPHIALDGGDDGFELYRKLFQEINEKGWKPELLVGEIDYTHGDLAKIEAEKAFPNSVVEIKFDLHHRQRILVITQDQG